MLRLVKIDYDEFIKDVYKEYLKLFPKEERKSLENLKQLFTKKLLNFVKIIEKCRLFNLCYFKKCSLGFIRLFCNL